MKKKNRIIIMICLVAIGLVVTYLAKPSNQEVYAKDFLNDFYKISDYQLCTYLVDSESSECSEYFTEDGYNQFISDQIYDIYEEYAYNHQCTFEVVSIQLEQQNYDSASDLRTFSFDALIQITYTDTDETEEINQAGTISVLNKDGTTKIDSIEIDNSNALSDDL